MNLILASDAYKQTHHLQYPPSTTHIYSYLESRGGLFRGTLFFGLQYYLQQYLEGPVIDWGDIEEAERFHKGLFGHTTYFNRPGWSRILSVHGGHLPLLIKAVPEGSLVPTGNVLMTIENTDPLLPWLPNFIETMLLRVWYPTTVATLSWQIRQLLARYANQTGGGIGPFALNDFGYRGVSSEESAELGGAAHLISFSGTDTLAGIRLAQKHYKAEPGVGMSVFASEHSTTTIYGREGEFSAYLHFIKAAGEGRIVSLVLDSWDYFAALNALCNRDDMRKAITAHAQSGGRVVIRPDSGDPPAVAVQSLEILARTFGYSVNSRGFRMLPREIGLIYGDGIDFHMIDKICRALFNAGWAIDSSNIVFGMGGGLLQSVNRDTQRFAFKCSAARREGEAGWFDVFKSPSTDPSKASKRGRLKLVSCFGATDCALSTVPESHPASDFLCPVFENGKILLRQSFGEICRRAAQPSLSCVGLSQ